MELQDYIGPLRRWWWLLVLGTLVAAASTYVAIGQQLPLYNARATLMIGRLISSSNPSASDIYLTNNLANSYADIAQRTLVRKAAMATLGMNWLPPYTVQPNLNTQLLEISVTDTDPQRAAAVATELAKQLIQQTPSGTNTETSQRQVFIHAQLDDLEAKIKDTEAEISKAQEALGSLLSAREIADTQAQIAALQSKLLTLQGNYAALLSNTEQGSANTLTLIEPAEVPQKPVAANSPRTIMLVALIGLILSAGAAYLLAYLDDTLKNPNDVKRTLHLTTLGAVPVIAAENGQELVMLASHHTAASEAYRVLRTNLQFAAVESPLRSLLITSPAPTEGKSITSANLAVALAQAGRRVVLVDADLHRPRQHRLFGLANSTGLTTALLEEHPAMEAILQATSVPGLLVLTSGPTPPNPTELLGSTRMRELLVELGTLADTIVLDSPPTVILADAAVLAAQTDGVLMVVNSGQTRRDIAQRAVETLRGVNARLIGVLLNRVSSRAGGYSYYYYYKGYGYSKNGKNQDSGENAKPARGGRSRRKGQPTPAQPEGGPQG